MSGPILAVEGVSKRFGGLYAVRDASLTVEAGRITAVIGPNGAGKTTLFALVAGFEKPDRGRILYESADTTGRAAYRLARQGIARTFQIVQPFAGLSVLENIAVGAHLHCAQRAAALEAAAEVAKLVGLEKVLNQSAATLTLAGAGNVTEAAPARRGAGRAQSVGNSRHAAGDPHDP
jgi:branched-chain amino acid transport system ATP-binding protein